jgi:hypothetical protein
VRPPALSRGAALARIVTRWPTRCVPDGDPTIESLPRRVHEDAARAGHHGVRQSTRSVLPRARPG